MQDNASICSIDHNLPQNRQSSTNSISHSNEKKELKPRWWHYFLAGEAAGMCGSVLCHPFDTTKTRIQMLSGHNQSTFKFMKQIIQNDGILALYRGVLYPFFGFGVLFSISFGVNGIFRNHFIRNNEKDIDRYKRTGMKATELSLPQLMIGGAFAGAASSVFRTPIERVKTWSQIHGTSTARSTINLLKTYGFMRGLWYGVVPTLGREVPQFTIYYPIYEGVCSLLSDPTLHGDKTQIEGWKIFAAGGAAGVGIWVSTYPIDVVKTRMQAAPPNTYKNLFEVAISIYKQGGHRGFWNGLVPTIYRAFTLHSAIFFFYERTLDGIQTITHYKD